MKVLLFGILAEKAESDSLEIDASTTQQLREALGRHIHQLDTYSYSIAVDKQIVHGDVPLTGQEEIAVLPPFAGG